MLDLRRR
jgi:putative ABC transport system substrate-binding protein